MHQEVETQADMATDEQLHRTMPRILCPLCGTQIDANPSNMCINCLKSEVDITEGISKQLIILWCRTCGRYQKPPWIVAALESRELLSLCLKKIRGMSKDVKLVDADFIYTEPHSRRLKVKVTVQKEMFQGAILQQQFVVEYVVQNLQCSDCQKSYTDHVWAAVLQVRQKVKHKRTFLWLEQLLIKHSVCAKTMGIKEISGGLDFYWGTTSQCQSMVHFLRGVVPIRTTESRKLISEDLTSNTKKFKYTFYAEMVPISRTDLVVLPKKLARTLGGVNELMLCTKVTSSLHLVDVTSLRVVELSAHQFFRDPFVSVMTHGQLIMFDVLNVVKEDANKYRSGRAESNEQNHKSQLCEVHIARASDFVEFHVASHLGNVLNPGDTVMGYDLTQANLIASSSEKQRNFPDCVLVKKCYPTRNNRHRHRAWKLKQLEKESEQKKKKNDKAREGEELEYFMREMEENPELRSKINIYKDPFARKKRQDDVDMEEDDEDDGYEEVDVKMDELLEDLGGLTVKDPFQVPDPFAAPDGSSTAEGDDRMEDTSIPRGPQRGQ